MQVREAMSTHPVFLPPTASLLEAAAKMLELDCGFIPVGENDKLIGAVTDRDIVVRAIAKAKDPKKLTLRDVMSKRIKYCFENEDIQTAAKEMQHDKIHRLVVLNKNKRMTGILSLGDIARKTHDDKLSGKTVEGILEED